MKAADRPHERSQKDRSLDNKGPALWLPFTAMRAFSRDPLLIESAAGMHYRTVDGHRLLDGMGGLWCVNAGHADPRIVAAISESAARLDFVSSFRMSHPSALSYAKRLCDFAPDGLEHAFLVNSGSEAVDTALKIARAYHAARGDGLRTKLIGRAKGYHGMGFGGLSVAGLGRQKRGFGPLLPDTAHISLPYDRDTMAFSHGQPETGAEFADDLERLLQVCDAATVAAVIVEPVTGSGGVYPPPKGYLERLRAICSRHGILLIFDEVITGFGRLGAPFASQAFGVIPDIMTCAKGMTNGSVPMGGVIVADHVYEAFMTGPEDIIELFHGYTYSAHPLACAAGIATLQTFEELDLVQRARTTAPIWERCAHTLKGAPHVIDVRTSGILGAVELAPRAGQPGKRGTLCANGCVEKGVLVRCSGDMIVLSPPLIITEEQIEEIFSVIGTVLQDIE